MKMGCKWDVNVVCALRSCLVGGWEAAAAEGAGGDPGGKAEKDPSHERTSGLQQTDQRKPV